MFDFKCKGRKKTDIPAQRQSSRRSSLLLSLFVLFRSSTDGWAPPTLGRPTWFNLSLLIQMFTSFQNTLTDTSRIMFDKMSGHPLAHSSWYIKLTITVLNPINHLRYISTHWNPLGSFKNIPFCSPTLRNPYVIGLRCILEIFKTPLVTLTCSQAGQMKYLSKETWWSREAAWEHFMCVAQPRATTN